MCVSVVVLSFREGRRQGKLGARVHVWVRSRDTLLGLVLQANKPSYPRENGHPTCHARGRGYTQGGVPHLIIHILAVVDLWDEGLIHKGWVGSLPLLPPVVGGGRIRASKHVDAVAMRVVHHRARVKQVVLVEQGLANEERVRPWEKDCIYAANTDCSRHA